MAHEPPSPQETISATAQAKKLQARIVTSQGEIIFTFFPDDAPLTVASFIKLARNRFYDGLTFHRVEPGFVVQGGDPNSRDGATGEVFVGHLSTHEPTFKDETDLQTLLSWADARRRLEIWANGDYPHDAERARDAHARHHNPPHARHDALPPPAFAHTAFCFSM